MINPLISIIVPIYNSEKYLRITLNSIQTQLFVDWECILVDDGSNDNSLGVCNEFVKKDNRFSIIHKENGGVSSARNAGIKKAKGDWLYFCDADDELVPEGLSILAQGISDNVDMINAGYYVVKEDGSLRNGVPVIPSELIDRHEMIKRLVYSAKYHYQGYLWCKLFRNCIIDDNNISFEENIFYNEDRLFIISYLCKSRSFVRFSTECVYNYIERPCGAMKSLNNQFNINFITDLTATIKIIQEIKDNRCSSDIINLWKKEAINSYDRILLFSRKFNCSEVVMKSRIKQNIIEEVGVFFYYRYRIFHQFPRIIKWTIISLSKKFSLSLTKNILFL